MACIARWPIVELISSQVALALRVTSEAAAMDELEQELSKLLEKNVVGGVVSAGGTTKALSQAEATSYRYWVSCYGAARSAS